MRIHIVIALKSMGTDLGAGSGRQQLTDRSVSLMEDHKLNGVQDHMATFMVEY